MNSDDWSYRFVHYKDCNHVSVLSNIVGALKNAYSDVIAGQLERVVPGNTTTLDPLCFILLYGAKFTSGYPS